MRRFITDRDETSEKILQVAVCKARANFSEVYYIATDIFIRVRFKQRSCMARYVDEKKKQGDHRAGVRAGTLCEIVKTMVINPELY